MFTCPCETRSQFRWAVDYAGHFCAIRREGRASAPILGSNASNVMLKWPWERRSWLSDAFWCFLMLSDAFWCFLMLSAKIPVKTRQKCQMSYSVCKDLSRHSLCLSRNVTCHSCILCVWNLNYLLVRPPHIKFGVFCCSCHKSIFIGFNTGMVRLSKTRRLHSQGSLCWKGSACLVQAVRFLQRDEGR